MIELVEFAQHFFYFLLEQFLLGKGKICFQFVVASFQWWQFHLHGVLLQQFRNIFGEEDQLIPVITPIFESEGGLDKSIGSVDLMFLQSEHCFQKNSLFIVITVIDGSVHGLVAVGEASHESEDAGEGKCQLGEGDLGVTAGHVEREEVKVGSVVEVVQPQTGLQVGQREFQLAVVELRDSSIGVVGRAGGLEQDDVVKEGETGLIVPLPIHLRRFLEETIRQLLDHSLRKLLFNYILFFRQLPPPAPRGLLPLPKTIQVPFSRPTHLFTPLLQAQINILQICSLLPHPTPDRTNTQPTLPDSTLLNQPRTHLFLPPRPLSPSKTILPEAISPAKSTIPAPPHPSCLLPHPSIPPHCLSHQNQQPCMKKRAFVVNGRKGQSCCLMSIK